MSNPVTNVEVEDVLSSIRRLVSEDKRPLAGLRSATSEPAAVSEPDREPDIDPAAGRLVLTPALRVAVNEDIPNEAPLDLGAVAQETWTKSENVETDQDGPLVLFPTSKEGSSEPDEAALSALIHDAVEAEAEPVEDGLEDGDYSDEEYWESEEQSASDTVEQPQVNDAADEELHDDANWDVDGSDTYSSFSEDDVEPTLEVADEYEEQQFFEPAVGNDAATTDQGDDVEEASVVPLTEKIAALEAAVGEIAQDWEPDGDAENELASADVPAMAWEDDVELDAKGAPMLDVVDEHAGEADDETELASDTDPVSGAFGVDDQLMDEEALRDLVSEIVRAELQGALGERITRNVRKLVRREIHRALTAQDME